MNVETLISVLMLVVVLVFVGIALHAAYRK